MSNLPVHIVVPNTGGQHTNGGPDHYCHNAVRIRKDLEK